MSLAQKMKPAARSFAGHWLFRYGLAVALFWATIGLSQLLTAVNLRLNLTIPIVLALVVTSWYGGRGPGLLIAAAFQTTTILYVPPPPDTTAPRQIFAYFSVFSLYVFLVLVISGLRKIQQRLAEHRDLLQVTLASIGDAVITTDVKGAVTFMNAVAQKLTGWDETEARGRLLDEVLDIVDEMTGEKVENPVKHVLATGGVVGLANHTILRSKDGREIPIADSAAPIRDGDTVKGVVLVFADVSERKAVEKARRESEIMHRIVEAQEAERHRIARDLHDHLGQKMTALRLRIEGLAGKWDGIPPLNEAVADLQASASEIDRDISYLSWELRPTELDSLGLTNALGSFVREWSRQNGIAAEFHTDENIHGNGRFDADVETNLYRIVQEALNNVLKHADAASVNVLLQQRDDHLVLIVEDDGQGFDPLDHSGDGNSPGGLGLLGMQERAALLRGDLEVDSRHGGGTTVMVKVPVGGLYFTAAH